MSVIPATQKTDTGDPEFKASLGKIKRPCLKNETQTKGQKHGLSDRVLAKMCKPLGSFPSTVQKKKF
jgi:hypothetical protein